MSAPSVDVLVVGGGILGVAHALAALQAGYSVLVCERSATPRGASVRNFGMLWPIGQPAGEDRRAALRTLELWSDLAPRAGVRLDECGSLHLAHSPDEAAVLEEFAASREFSDLSLLSPADALALQPRLEPRGLLLALHSPHEAHVDPPLALARLHVWLNAQGVQLRTRCAVTEVESGGARLADGTRVNAERIVVCSGDDFETLFPELFAASDLRRCKLQMLALELGDEPARGPMLAAGLTLLHYKSFANCASLPSLRARVERELPECLARGIHVLVARSDDGLLIVGDSHEYGSAFTPGLDAFVEHLITAQLARWLRTHDARIVRRWSGVYSTRAGGATSFRAQPLLGVEIVTGVGGSGMTRSLALGEQTVQAWRTTNSWTRSMS